MGDAAKHEHGWMHGGPPWARSPGGMSPFFIPIPMAFFGVVISFMFGWTVGAMSTRKAMTWGGGKPWQKHGMGMGHHHHGSGAPACREWHGDWPEEAREGEAGNAGDE